MPRENGPDDASTAVFSDAETSRAVIDVAKHQGLPSLSGFPFEVRTSASTREQAKWLADRCGRAYSYLGEMLAFRPRCALLALNRADWSERAANPSYVMPYYDPGNLFLTGEPSDLAAWLEEVASSAPPARFSPAPPRPRIGETYAIYRNRSSRALYVGHLRPS